MSRALAHREARMLEQSTSEINAGLMTASVGMSSVIDGLLSHETPAQAWLRQAGPHFARMNEEARAELTEAAPTVDAARIAAAREGGE